MEMLTESAAEKAPGGKEVTAPLRAPFTEFQEEGGPREVEESPRGSGIRRAIGELLACPFGMSQWVAISDFLQIHSKGSEETLL